MNYYKLSSYEQRKISGVCNALNIEKHALSDEKLSYLLEAIEKIYSDGFEDGKNDID